MIPLAWNRGSLTRDDFEAARRLTVAEKFRAGGDLFDQECQVIKDRIRAILPNAGEELVRDLMHLAIQRIHGGD